jgi:hypothetical protein
MAVPDNFRKLTDAEIPSQSGTVATNDLFHTVDVSDTTDGAAGTSKRTTIQKVIDVVQDNIILPTLASGTWTPTLGDFNGCVTDAVGISGFYTRVNNIVTATIYASVDLDFSLGSGIGYCDFDVPIATSFAERIGVGQLYQNSTDCNIASNSSKIYFYSKSSSDIGATTFTFTFQYEIS